MVKRGSWLSLTPEPERELPEAVATLRSGGQPSRAAVDSESARIERLVLRGSERAWLRYLHGVVELIDSRAAAEEPAVVGARRRATQVIANHHNLLLALPGSGAQRTSHDRARLATAQPAPDSQPPDDRGRR
ncbi:MAG: hypothetical protein JO181_07675 [Solirubrobacterales bacterium]|nr:hypothetical protein [Solirubrobacterales bacterium]